MLIINIVRCRYIRCIVGFWAGTSRHQLVLAIAKRKRALLGGDLSAVASPAGKRTVVTQGPSEAFCRKVRDRITELLLEAPMVAVRMRPGAREPLARLAIDYQRRLNGATLPTGTNNSSKLPEQRSSRSPARQPMPSGRQNKRRQQISPEASARPRTLTHI